MTGPSDHQCAVLVVGGGITGLSTALFLARQGVRPILVERHPSTAIMPQARAFNPRSMEIFRAFGLEREIRGRQSILAELPEMIGAETLAGRERFRVDMLAEVRPGAISPTDWAMIDQDELERIVRAHAERAGADVRFGTELVALAGDTGPDTGAGPGGVTATVHEVEGGGRYRIHAEHLVAADGNRAGIRGLLGVGADGPGVLGHAAHFLFDADLDDALRGRRFLLGYLDRPRTGTVLVPLRRAGRWMLGVPFDPRRGERIEDFTEPACVDLVRRATGIPDLDLTLVPPVAGRGCAPMDVRIGAAVARRYRSGQVFLAGDAAHVFPPTGSFGANAGIADGHNLAWKIAAVRRGQAGPALLDSYDAERRPVALATMDAAVRILQARHHGAGAEATRIDEVGTAIGYRYASAAVHTEAGTPADAVEDPRTPSGRPGLRAPHVWLERGGVPVSTLDLFTGRFTVLAGPDGGRWVAAAESAAAQLGVEPAVHRIGADLHDPHGRWPGAYGVSRAGVSLVRPDGFVGWRAASLPERPDRELGRALGGLLARAGAGVPA